MNEREALDAIRALCDREEVRLGYQAMDAIPKIRAVLDRVESSPPPAIDRDAIKQLVQDLIEAPDGFTIEGWVDEVLALVRPVAGVTLTPEEAHDAATCVRMVIEGAVSDRRTEAHLGALAARREAGDA